MKRVLPLTLLAMAACGSSGASSASAVLAAVVSPDPIQEGPCPASHCGSLAGQNEASGLVTLSESAGVGARVTSVGMSLRVDATQVVIASGQFDAAAVTATAGSVLVNGHGQLVVPVGVHYDQAVGGQPGTMTVTVSATDDNGHALSASDSVAVVP